MPIENEQKYILSPAFPESALSDWKHVPIRQGYLDDGPRIRQYGDEYVFTYKRWLDDENAQVEIETTLSPIDFNRLWPFCTISLSKDRYIKHTGELEWVVDFLKDENDSPYFILAEVEMPEGMVAPDKIIQEIRDVILYAPEKGDKNYTNKKLAKQHHASQLLKSLTA